MYCIGKNPVETRLHIKIGKIGYLYTVYNIV